MNFCPKCGRPHTSDAKFCPTCGLQFIQKRKHNKEENKKKNINYFIPSLVIFSLCLIIINHLTGIPLNFIKYLDNHFSSYIANVTSTNFSYTFFYQGNQHNCHLISPFTYQFNLFYTSVAIVIILMFKSALKHLYKKSKGSNLFKFLLNFFYSVTLNLTFILYVLLIVEHYKKPYIINYIIQYIAQFFV